MGSSFYLMDYHHGHGEVPYVRFLEDNPFAACIITMRTATTRYVVHLPEKVISLQKKRTIPIDSYKLQRLKWPTEPKVYKYLILLVHMTYKRLRRVSSMFL
jgi:hypothetical protein